MYVYQFVTVYLLVCNSISTIIMWPPNLAFKQILEMKTFWIVKKMFIKTTILRLSSNLPSQERKCHAYAEQLLLFNDL